MNGPQKAHVLLATLTVCVSGRGSSYLRGWAGASNLVAFAGEPDEQGRPTWDLYLTERQPRDGTPAPPQRAQAGEPASGQPAVPSTPVGRSWRPLRRPERTAAVLNCDACRSTQPVAQDDDDNAGSAGARATARWRERMARGSIMVPVELFHHEVEGLVRRGLLPRDQVHDRPAIGYAVAQLVEALLSRSRPTS